MKQDVMNEMLAILAAEPDGLSARAVGASLSRKLSQPTVWRHLDALRARGAVTVEGKARATRYHAADRTARADLRSRRLHESVARRVARDPSLATLARARLNKLRAVNPHGRPYHDRWDALLSGPTTRLLRAMTEDSESADALRRESPFTVLIDRRERERIFKRFSAA